MRPHRPAWITATALIGLAFVAPSRGMDDENPVVVRLEAMRSLAKGVALVDAKSGSKVAMIPEPVYRFDDPARAFSDGSIWAFGKSGRPAAILCLSLMKGSGGDASWLHELTSLADGPIKASSQHESGPWSWTAKASGLEFSGIPKAPTPADNDARRLTQMKDLARRFKAFESVNQARTAPSDRFELRLLPQPIHRYHDPEHGIIDGGVFLLSYGRNPEIGLIIEASHEAKGDPTWRYALARIAGARLTVSIDDREVADLAVPSDFGSTRPYFLFWRRASELKD